MHSRIIFLQPEGEFALEAVAAEVEHKAVDPNGEERGKGYPEFGEVQGVEQGKDGKDEQCQSGVSMSTILSFFSEKVQRACASHEAQALITSILTLTCLLPEAMTVPAWVATVSMTWVRFYSF